ncbi:MAG TPA: hypothetical protein VGM03_23315 [Phycisphaerae bacterium]
MFAGTISLRPSQNDYDWLGHGIYFWENNPQRALDYALQLQARPERSRSRIVNPAVVGAVIDLGRCLNLIDAHHLRLVKDAYETLLAHGRQAGTAMPKNRRPKGSREWLLRPLDCAVIETLHRVREEQALPDFESVRGAFIEGPLLYAGAGFHERTHIQICVRSLRCIQGYFRVLSEPPGELSPE